MTAAASNLSAAANQRSDKSARADRILVVDDSLTIRALLHKTLNLFSYDVEEAADGWEALAMLEQDQDFDLLIVDLLMPRLNGTLLIKHLRLQPSFPRFPILILTGADVDPQAGLPPGADAILAKPFIPSLLLKTIRELIRQYRKPK